MFIKGFKENKIHKNVLFEIKYPRISYVPLSIQLEI